MPVVDFLVRLLAGYIAITLAFYMASYAAPKASFVARALASYLSLLVCATLGVFASILFTLIGKQGISQWATARAFHYVMALTTGIVFEIDDPDNVLGTTRPAVFIGNHQTELDVLMLGALFPKWCSVTAKSDLKKIPFLGWFMRLSGSVFIDRRNSKDARDAMASAAREIQVKRQSVYMFPEGTRSYAKDPLLLPFKKGAFHLAVQAGVPIVPCVVANYSHILHLKTMVFRAGRIPVKVLDPIPTKGLTTADVDELTHTTRDLMLKELQVLTYKARGRPMPVPVPASNHNHSAESSTGQPHPN